MIPTSPVVATNTEIILGSLTLAFYFAGLVLVGEWLGRCWADVWDNYKKRVGKK
jgi:hypothetical protein